jgi:hypothetical protein
MALSNTLNTNEVKNSAGTEQEFQHRAQNDRRHEWALITETPALPHRLLISHQDIGAGLKARRRSVVRIDKTVMSTVDTTLPVVVSSYLVLDAPVGALLAMTEPTHVLANVLSFCASLGASTTILYDGTGNGAAALLAGTL